MSYNRPQNSMQSPNKQQEISYGAKQTYQQPQQMMGGIKTVSQGLNLQNSQSRQATMSVPAQKSYNIQALQSSSNNIASQAQAQQKEPQLVLQNSNSSNQSPNGKFAVTQTGNNINLLNENERLKTQVEVLQKSLESAKSFEKSQSVLDLVGFQKMVQENIEKLLDELYDSKRQVQELKQKNVELEVGEIQGKGDAQLKKELLQSKQENLALKDQIERLEKQNKQLEQKSSASDTIEKEELQQQVRNLHLNLQNLSEECNKLSSKNEEYHSKLKQKDFFQEYENNLREVDGLRKENQKIMIELKQKKDELAVKNGEVPPSQQQQNMIAAMSVQKKNF